MSAPSAPSIVRTIVPVIVGAIVSYLATIGVTLPDDVMSALSVIITAAASAAYYVAVRWLEQKWPHLGVLLGWAAVPESYTSAADREIVESEVVEPDDDGPRH